MSVTVESIAVLSGVLLLAALVEALVEYLVSPLVEPMRKDDSDESTDWRVIALRYVSVVIGIALCFAYKADLLSIFGLVSPVWWVGPLVTGCLIGRGANFVHDFASRWLRPS